ncbi:MAG TPA: hypothetical protein VFR87_10915, partial [Nocardioidaceae bacterium]|nr:hypothetical protein [Nocardioidaceae bacterium]
VVPYLSPDTGGPPGQTAMGNLGLLTRFAHRVKTHGRWSLREPTPGVFEWRSPHGYRFRVDHHGTHYLGKNPDVQHDAAPEPQAAEDRSSVDVWVSPLEVELTELIARAG